MDIPGAIGRASRLLRNAPGERWLLIAAPIAPAGAVPGIPSLEGVQIRFVLPHLGAANVGLFDDYEAAWVTWAAGLQSDLKVLDPSDDLLRELN